VKKLWTKTTPGDKGNANHKKSTIFLNGLLTMRKLIGLIAVGVLFSIAQAASAGPFEDGNAAYDQGDYATALKLWRPLADNGNAEAQFALGNIFYEGQGVLQNYTESVKWFRKAADQGYVHAQYKLGVIYREGQGVLQNYTESVKWHRKAADQGYADSQFVLGNMYADGIGVPQDYIQAHKWLNLAAAHSNVSQKMFAAIRDSVAKRMTAQQIEQAQEMARHCESSKYKQCD
jgi:uncharacterized protein